MSQTLCRTVLALFAVAASAPAEEHTLTSLIPGTATAADFWKELDNPAGTPDSAYVGGRGNITIEGPTGLFINPTSGTAPKGQMTVQACTAVFQNPDGSTTAGYAGIASYAIHDWLEVGAVLFDVANDGNNPALGPMIRARFVKEKTKVPEVSVGFYSYEDTNPLFGDYKRVIFAAVSKAWKVRDNDKGWFETVRAHGGVRVNWRDVGESGDAVGYFGADISLPKHLYFAAEVSSEDNNFPHTPYAYGLQLRHPEGYGFTLAAIQPGVSSGAGVYIGIGINF